MKYKLQTVSSFTVGQTSNWLEPRKPNFEPMLNQKWAEPRPNFGKPTTTGLSTKTELRYKKNLFEPSKKSEPTNWEFDSTLKTRSSSCLSAFTGIDESEMKSDVTTQNFVENLKNLHSCIPIKWAAPMFFFHSPTINTMYSEISFFLLDEMTW